MGKICVLRLGHRSSRDQRITTHVFLAARALGADEGVLCGDKDESVISGVRKVCALWGGGFEINYEQDWQKFLAGRKSRGWKIAHLTMYGEDFEKAAKRLSKENVVVVVGAGKVPRETYELADFNLAVANQPHSEVSALALFLDRVCGGREFHRKLRGKLTIIPNKCGKNVVRGKNE
jgi:tRNA (cytidine56-2'-O)-methyltransferase